MNPDEKIHSRSRTSGEYSKPLTLQLLLHLDSIILGNHPKAAIDYHLKTGHRETA
jgi:hypothetical protein